MNLENASRILITAATVGSVSLSCKSNSAMSAYAKAKICGLVRNGHYHSAFFGQTKDPYTDSTTLRIYLTGCLDPKDVMS